MAATWAPVFAFQVHIAEYQTKFDNEKNAVRRAKLMDKLGELQFEQIRADVRDDDLDTGIKVLDSYVEDCETVHRGLRDSGVNAEKKPDGFKQLEVSVRMNLHRLDEMLADIDAEEKKPFVAAKKKLMELNKQLVHELFPRQPEPDDSQ
jgi:hypothetical protein